MLARLLLLAFSALTAFAVDWSVKPVKVASLPTYTEGVVLDRAGNIFVSHADRISRVTPDGKVSEWARLPSPNGHKVLGNGDHLVCDRKGTIFRLGPNGKIKQKVFEPPHGANDICLDPINGGFYFTSPYESRILPRGRLYYVDSAGKATLLTEGLGYGNGVVLRPDGKTLLVGESQFNRILEYPVLAPGKLGAPKVFAYLPGPREGQPVAKPDGMTLDEDGNLYIAHYGTGSVRVLDREGELLATLQGSWMFTSNVAFGGPNRDQLYVTGSVGPTEQTEGILMRFDLDGVRGVQLVPTERCHAATMMRERSVPLHLSRSLHQWTAPSQSRHGSSEVVIAKLLVH